MNSENIRLKKNSIIAGFNDAWNGDLDYDDFIVHIDNSEHKVGAAVTTSAPIPEPATMFLLGTGLIGIAGLGRKRFIK